jgi:hypothetical protein
MQCFVEVFGSEDSTRSVPAGRCYTGCQLLPIDDCRDLILRERFG